MDQMKSKREKVTASIFRSSRAANFVVRCWIWPNFKLIQALMYVIVTCKYERIWWRTAEEKWQHLFFHYKAMGIFSDAQGQLTPQTVVESGRILNSSELSCMSLLSASMKRIGWKTAEKKWQHRFSYYNPMGAICCQGNQGSDLAEFRTH